MCVVETCENMSNMVVVGFLCDVDQLVNHASTLCAELG